MYCSYCGAQIPDVVNFCSYCGAKLPVLSPRGQEGVGYEKEGRNGYKDATAHSEESSGFKDTIGYDEESGGYEDTIGYGEKSSGYGDAIGHGEESGSYGDAIGHGEESGGYGDAIGYGEESSGYGDAYDEESGGYEDAIEYGEESGGYEDAYGEESRDYEDVTGFDEEDGDRYGDTVGYEEESDDSYQDEIEYPAKNSGYRNAAQKNWNIVSVFNTYFSPNDSYGTDLMIMSREKFPYDEEDELLYDDWEKLKRYIGRDRILMAYDYCGKGEMGFIITERKIVTEDQYGIQQYLLKDIKSFVMAKRILADVMYVVTVDNKAGRDIYLTSIRDMKLFQATFLKFFSEVYRHYHPESVEEKKESSLYDLGAICEKYSFNSISAENGSPLNERNSKKYNKAFVNFAINSDEQVYFIYDVTVFGSCKQGFAVCSSGLYGCDSNNQKFYLPWETFKTTTYKRGVLEFKIGRRGLTTAGDTAAIIRMFDAIKSGL